MRDWIHPLKSLILLLAVSGTADAQLFGPRTFGQPLARRTGAGMFSQAGALQGNERFLRGNRGRRDFVGSDRREQQGFVGSEQARTEGSVVSSVAGLRERPDRGSQINRPLAKPDTDEMYHPKLRVSFAVPSMSATDVETRLTRQLADSNRFSARARIVVSVEERTAILRGVVTSASEHDLAELVVLVEPGISRVRNDLAVLDSPDLPRPPAIDWGESYER